MIAERYHCTRVNSVIRVFLFLLLISLTASTVKAQDRGFELQAAAQRAPIELSDDARVRIESTIAARRLEKQQLQGAELIKFRADREVIATAKAVRSASAADQTYGSGYFDTQAGNDYSFPEDSHDFCRASFMSNADEATVRADVEQDYYLDMVLANGETIDVALNWSSAAPEFSDYDLYLFDVDGYSVEDPAGQISGANGINFQTDDSGRTEAANATNNSGSEQPVLLVVDRFRGVGGNSLDIVVSGSDAAGAFSVVEYVAGSELTYLSGVTLMPLDGATVSPADASSFIAGFATDGCEQSVVFTLLDAQNNPVVADETSNARPFNAYEGTTVSLPAGAYELTAISYSQTDGQGVYGDTLVSAFTVVEDQPTASIDSYTLINAATDQPVDGFDPIAEGAVIDLIALFNGGISRDVLETQLNLRANVTDPDGQIQAVNSNLLITLVTEVPDDEITVTNSDAGAAYSVYGDDDGVPTTDFTDAALPLGAYQLTGVPVINGADGDGYTVNFTIIGPRIESYTLINTDTNDPVDGANGQPDHDPIAEGAVIDLTVVGTQNVSIRANTVDYEPPAIESVRFDFFDGEGNFVKDSNNESYRPYALYGDPTDDDLDPPYDDVDPNGDPKPDYGAWTGIQNGNYQVSGVPYTQNQAMGDRFARKSLNFSISNASAGAFEGGLDRPTLFPNFPNPFNPVTTISFGIPEASEIQLIVYDMLGREVKVLVNGTLEAGVHEVSFEAGSLSSGMYLYRLETPAGVQVRKMTLLK